MQNISFMQNVPTHGVMSFKATKPGRNYDPQAGMPRPKDSYLSTYKIEQEKKNEKTQKIGMYSLLGLALVVGAWAISQLMLHGTLKSEAISHKKLLDAERKKLAGEEINDKLTKNIYEDLTNELGIKEMSLHKDLVSTTNDIINQVKNFGEVVERGGEGIRSILLYGPPGTGKTTYAKAIAKEIPNTKFVVLDVTKMKDKYVGETEKNINALIDKVCANAKAMTDKYNKELAEVIGEDIVKSGDKKAIERAIAEAKGAGKKVPELERIIVFVDEIDSVMMVDKSADSKFSNDVLNEFKKGFTEKLGKQENVITIGATNLEIDAKKAAAADGKTLDKPMLDRFASKIRVPNPDAKQIEETIMRHYSDKRLVDNELKTKNSRLTKLATYLAKEEHNTSFRTLKAIFNKTSNATSGSGKNVSIDDIKNVLKQMKDELHMNDSGISAI